MNKNKIIIYDDTCPLCTWYTGAFVKTGLLEKDGRRSFSEVDHTLAGSIDQCRCKNEIPVIDTRSGSVVYGVDALLSILGTKFPVVKTVGRIRFVNWFIRRLYKLISYNRRVIIAAEKKSTGFDCTPDFNVKYRLTFLILVLIANTLILFPVHQYLFSNSLFTGSSVVQVQYAHLLLVLSNVLIALHLNRADAYEYLGQVSMLALTAILLCLPLIFLHSLFKLPAVVTNIFMAAILFFIIKEYFRRIQCNGLSRNHKRIMPLNVFCLIIFLLYLSN